MLTLSLRFVAVVVAFSFVALNFSDTVSLTFCQVELVLSLTVDHERCTFSFSLSAVVETFSFVSANFSETVFFTDSHFSLAPLFMFSQVSDILVFSSSHFFPTFSINVFQASEIPSQSPAMRLPPISLKTVDGECMPKNSLTQAKKSTKAFIGCGIIRPSKMPPIMSPPMDLPSLLVPLSNPRAFLSPFHIMLPTFLKPSAMPPAMLVAIVPQTTPLNIFLKVHFAANTLNMVAVSLSQSTSFIAWATPDISLYQSTLSMTASTRSAIPFTMRLIVSPAFFQSIESTALLIKSAMS